MIPDGFWELFAETGEPMCWLLSRAQERLPRRTEAAPPREAAQPEPPPRPE